MHTRVQLGAARSGSARARYSRVPKVTRPPSPLNSPTDIVSLSTEAACGSVGPQDQQTASGTSPITLYAVDPASGASSALTVARWAPF